MLSVCILAWVLQVTIPQKSTTNQPRSAQDTAISGTVIDSMTGTGIKGVRVFARDPESEDRSAGVITDANGRFALVGVTPGQYVISAERTGYVGGNSDRREALDSSNVITIADGQTLAGIIVRLTPAAAISGRILDQDGDPICRAVVAASRIEWGEGRREFQVRGLAETDDRGHFRVFGLSPGRYYLAAGMRTRSPEVFQSSRGSGEQTYAPTYFPGTIEPENAEAIELKPGDDLDSMDFSLLAVKVVKVRGYLVDGSTGNPLEEASVYLEPRSHMLGLIGPLRLAGAEIANGVFVLTGVVPGSYDLMAWYDRDSRRMSARVPIEVDDDGIDGVTIPLFSNVDVLGHLSFEGDTSRGPEALWLSLNPADGSDFGAGSARPDPDGNFKFDSVAQGEYRLKLAENLGDTYLKTVSLGGRQNADQSIVVDRDTHGKRLEVVLSARGARIEGVAIDDEKRPVASALVVLVPGVSRRNREDLFQNSLTDAQGRFVLSGIPPGEYTLFAWPSERGVSYRNPDWLAGYETRGSVVHVAEGTHLNIQVRTIAPDEPSQ